MRRIRLVSVGNIGNASIVSNATSLGILLNNYMSIYDWS